MSIQTPKNYEKKSPYTSPIGLLKNYNTMNATNSNNSYQEQFYRIKAQRLEAEVQELKEENSILRAKLTDSTAANQILKEKLITQENGYERGDRSFTQRTVPSFITDSGYPSGNNSGRESPSMMETKYFSVSIPNEKSQRSAYNNELERLIKQNRVLKNQHELEMSKLRDQNKKLNRKILQLQTIKKTMETEPEIQEKSYRQKLDERCLKIEKVNNQLRKQNEEFQKEKKKTEERVRILEQNNKSLRRQNEELKILGSSKTRNESAIQELQIIAQQKQVRYKEETQKLLSQIAQLQQNIKSQQTLRQPQKPQPQQNPPLSSTTQKLQKQIDQLKRKLAHKQQSLQQKDQEIKNILLKLKPLMDKDKTGKNASNSEIVGDPKKASLSILDIFLSKYKINTF